jgi:hypothetical protein
MAAKVFRLPKEIPMEEYPKPEVFLDEARRLVDDAQRQGLYLRVMGPIALHFHFPQYVDLYYKLERLGERVFTDIDFASYGKFRGKMVDFFHNQGYEIEKQAMLVLGQQRHIYFGGAVPMIDIFYDALDMNHKVDYTHRLELHPYCVTLTDLLLQKLQIVQINEKDLKDCLLLFTASPVDTTDTGAINASYVAKIMANDWGFCYTSTMNLEKVKKIAEMVPALTPEQRVTICSRVDQVLSVIENEPKSLKWKMRARTGAKKQWYNEVADWD